MSERTVRRWLQPRPGQPTVPVQSRTRWTEPHTLSLLELRDLPVRRVAITVYDDDLLLRRARRAGRVVEEVTVSTRFAATLVRDALLRHVDRWRVEGAPQVLGKGYTQVWLAVAPHPLLRQLAAVRFTAR